MSYLPANILKSLLIQGFIKNKCALAVRLNSTIILFHLPFYRFYASNSFMYAIKQAEFKATHYTRNFYNAGKRQYTRPKI
ncbi:MAG: hypothetical protein DRH93_03345 [Deltaproteobacteria bacterium]|nr:MAG: hypothetical protein DRH93_03345 [Deltaproteobacteria bacterium]